MSCNENKSVKNEKCSAYKDLACAAVTAADAVLTSIAGTKLFQKAVAKIAASGADVAKAKRMSGAVGASLCANVLAAGEFVPTLAQAIDRLMAGKPCCEAEEIAEEATEEIIPVIEEIVEAPVESVAAMASVEENDSDDDDDENESFGFSTAGLDFFDPKEEPEKYAALLAQEQEGEIQIVTRYRRSFLSRLIQSQGDVQTYYSELKNKLLSYKGVKGRTSWGYESFNKGRTYVAKMNAKAKTLYLYLALDPEAVAALEDGKYNIVDVSATKKYENVPVLMKIKGPRKFKQAMELVDMLCRDNLLLPDAKNFEAQDYTVPYQSTEELVESGSIKKLVAGIAIEKLQAQKTEA